MSAVDNYRESERLLGLVARAPRDGTEAAELIGLAQVHATLALAGATALQSYARVGDDDELDDWKAAAGGES
ncbi:MAG: hypothetical protein EPO40_02915 [Myxococcaceae bacterium]|nr:MAG: hypothetical protein EPO40_02915 [Myxococcaceae bacterium]